MRSVLCSIVLIIGVLLTNVSIAALNIQITKGVQAPLPVAVVPFENQANPATQASDNKNTTDTNMASVIYNDLQNSGYFNLTPFNQLHQFPHTVADVNHDYWQHLGIDNVVVGQVIPEQAGRVTVNVGLVNVFQNKSQQGSALLERTYTVDKEDLRRLAHHISDVIYAQLTGEKGVFSTQIAYVVVVRAPNKPTEYRLEVADFDGYNATTILRSNEPIMSPAWSPDGKQLAYVSFEKKQAQIYINDVASGQRELVSHYDGINGAPSWSPDGKQLALVLSKSGQPKIYTLDLQTKQLRQVTSGWSIDTEPVWTRDGKSIYFTSDRGGSPQIYQVNLADEHVQRVTFDGRFNARASLSAEGDEMVVLHRDGSGFNVALYDIASGEMRSLTNAGHNQSPTLAPNGRLVMYATHFGGKEVLAIISTDGNVSMRLPAREGDVQEPAWSPFLG